MNERIKTLAEHAGLKVEGFMTNPPKPFQILGTPESFEKFAELLIRECAAAIDTVYEKAPPARGCYDWATFAVGEDILNHFELQE